MVAMLPRWARHGRFWRTEVRLVSHAEIKENGWDLNIGRYLKASARSLAGRSSRDRCVRRSSEPTSQAEAEFGRSVSRPPDMSEWVDTTLGEVSAGSTATPVAEGGRLSLLSL